MIVQKWSRPELAANLCEVANSLAPVETAQHLETLEQRGLDSANPKHSRLLALSQQLKNDPNIQGELAALCREMTLGRLYAHCERALRAAAPDGHAMLTVTNRCLEALVKGFGNKRDPSLVTTDEDTNARIAEQNTLIEHLNARLAQPISDFATDVQANAPVCGVRVAKPYSSHIYDLNLARYIKRLEEAAGLSKNSPRPEELQLVLHTPFGGDTIKFFMHVGKRSMLIEWEREAKVRLNLGHPDSKKPYYVNLPASVIRTLALAPASQAKEFSPLLCDGQLSTPPSPLLHLASALGFVRSNLGSNPQLAPLKKKAATLAVRGFDISPAGRFDCNVLQLGKKPTFHVIRQETLDPKLLKMVAGTLALTEPTQRAHIAIAAAAMAIESGAVKRHQSITKPEEILQAMKGIILPPRVPSSSSETVVARPAAPASEATAALSA